MRDWNEPENRAIVTDYFAMLVHELRGEPYNKAARNKAVRDLLNGRSHGSVEFKHANISAVLREMGAPIVDGYKPRGNYQDALVAAVTDYLRDHPDVRALMDHVAALVPANDRVAEWASPDRQVSVPPSVVRETPAYRYVGSRTPIRFDYAERDAANRRLGELGEDFVLKAERARLTRDRRDDLAARVEWVSKSRGDGLGYDIRSFETDGSETFIEVKTTNFGLRQPFIISSNEVRVSEIEDERYRLYRVVTFARDPRFFVLHGAVSRSCNLDPRTYSARVAG